MSEKLSVPEPEKIGERKVMTAAGLEAVLNVLRGRR